ncbi:hypothetical protein H3C61_02850 [Candidatus Gracilibacteria bacterium]|nr:hypothetical protein [Candidatus Gracilibacteria bacterium]
MKTFKIEVAKGLQKFNLVKKVNSETELKEQLHKEGFSILSIQSIEESEIDGNKYFFEILNNGELKTGTIVSNDIFKAYLKIKYQLKYDLKYIYQNQNESLIEKEKIINELESQYRIYLETNKKNLEKTNKKEEIIKKEVVEETTDSFLMKKEIDNVYNILNKALEKLKYFIEIPNNEYLDFEKKEKLKNIYTEILKLKSGTNITKLKEIGELALIKIGEIELKILETKKDENSKKLLKETNKLLKEVGSKSSFIAKEDDFGYIMKTFFNSIKETLKPSKEKKEKFSIDTTSGTFLKTKLLIEKYESKLKELRKEKLKNFFIYIIPSKENNKIKINFYLKEKVLKQNIMIFKSRLTGKTFSYTKVLKGYYTFVGKIIYILNISKIPLLFLVLFYSVIFLLLNLFNYFKIYNLEINFHGLFYFILLNLILILIKYTSGAFSLIFNIVFFSFLFIFGVINF